MFFWRKWRGRSVKLVLDEIEEIYHKYHLDTFILLMEALRILILNVLGYLRLPKELLTEIYQYIIWPFFVRIFAEKRLRN